MAQADIQLVSLSDEPLFSVTMPSKLQSILSAGHPVLVAANGDAARVVLDARAGLVAKAQDPQSISEAVRQFRRLESNERRTMGVNGRRYYDEHMSEQVGARRLVGILQAAVATRRGAVR